MANRAFFEGLIYDESENPVVVTTIGNNIFYVVDDDGFLRHIEADRVDRKVLQVFVEQLHANKDMAVEQAMKMMGKDDLFTKAALDSQMNNVDVDQILEHGLPEQGRTMMGMMGFRVIINVHGEVLRLDQPSLPGDIE